MDQSRAATCQWGRKQCKQRCLNRLQKSWCLKFCGSNPGTHLLLYYFLLSTPSISTWVKDALTQKKKHLKEDIYIFLSQTCIIRSSLSNKVYNRSRRSRRHAQHQDENRKHYKTQKDRAFMGRVDVSSFNPII